MATRPYLTAFCMFTITFISPLVLGLIIALLDQKQIIRRVFDGVGLHALHSTPSAWDYKFGQLNATDGRWLLVELKDNRKVGGWYGSNSFASSDPTERELYLEETWILPPDSENADWVKRDKTDGILIRHDDIRTVSFIYDPTHLEENVPCRQSPGKQRWNWVSDRLHRRSSPSAIDPIDGDVAITNGFVPGAKELHQLQAIKEPAPCQTTKD